MKAGTSIAKKRSPQRRGRTPGFTLPEMLVSFTLFVLLVGGVVVANLFGFRWYQITQTKLLAADSARKSIGHMADEIRTCNSLYVGNVSNLSFTGCTNGQLQQGNSLMVYQSTNTSNYIMYFFSTSDGTFRRFASVANTTTILASSVTNSAAIFQMQDYLGNVQTNSFVNNNLIHCSLQYYTSSSTNPVANFYQIQTSAKPRLIQ